MRLYIHSNIKYRQVQLWRYMKGNRSNITKLWFNLCDNCAWRFWKTYVRSGTNFNRLDRQMAITAVTNCLGPPPLPPGKRFLQKSSRKLSSTYKSFRDPAVETWLSHGIPENLMAKMYLPEMTVSKIGANQSLFRSCSEGNLRARETTVLPSSTPLNKCIKAIYGSWKNLLHRKYADCILYIGN